MPTRRSAQPSTSSARRTCSRPSRSASERMAPLVYASSIAAYDAMDEADPSPDMKATPGTIYGVFKRANEGSAQIYWADHGVASVGLRPHTVYGPGRDQGVTSAPTTAMLAAAAGMPYHLPYGGSAQLQYVPDVARAFIQASLSQATGAHVYDLPGEPVHVTQVIEAISSAVPASAGTITFDDVTLPFPAGADDPALEQAIGRARAHAAAGRRLRHDRALREPARRRGASRHRRSSVAGSPRLCAANSHCARRLLDCPASRCLSTRT